MSDPLAAFADLQDFPGKKKPVNRAPPKEAPEADPWDAKPRTYRVKGEPTEFFTVGDLAVAVNRTARTIRHWENMKWLPPATFRAPKPRQSALKDAGDRLYSHAQIDVVVAAAAATGVLDGKPPGKEFTARVVKGWTELQQQKG